MSPYSHTYAPFLPPYTPFVHPLWANLATTSSALFSPALTTGGSVPPPPPQLLSNGIQSTVQSPATSTVQPIFPQSSTVFPSVTSVVPSLFLPTNGAGVGTPPAPPSSDSGPGAPLVDTLSFDAQSHSSSLSSKAEEEEEEEIIEEN